MKKKRSPTVHPEEKRWTLLSTNRCISGRADAHAFLFISAGKGSSGKHICASARRIPERAEVQSHLQELSKLSKGSAGALKPAGNSTGTSGRDVRRLLLIPARSRHQWDEDGEIAAKARDGGREAGGRREGGRTRTNGTNFGGTFAPAATTAHLCVIHPTQPNPLTLDTALGVIRPMPPSWLVQSEGRSARLGFHPFSPGVGVGGCEIIRGCSLII